MAARMTIMEWANRAWQVLTALVTIGAFALAFQARILAIEAKQAATDKWIGEHAAYTVEMQKTIMASAGVIESLKTSTQYITNDLQAIRAALGISRGR